MQGIEGYFKEEQRVIASRFVDCANIRSCRLARAILLERWHHQGMITREAVSKAVEVWEDIDNKVYIADPGSATPEECRNNCSVARFCLQQQTYDQLPLEIE